MGLLRARLVPLGPKVYVDLDWMDAYAGKAFTWTFLMECRRVCSVLKDSTHLAGPINVSLAPMARLAHQLHSQNALSVRLIRWLQEELLRVPNVLWARALASMAEAVKYVHKAWSALKVLQLYLVQLVHILQRLV